MYIVIRSGPQHRMICALEGSMMLTALRRLCGQLSTGPSGVSDQSLALISAPISPPPASQGATAVGEATGKS